ncbi:MAG: TIGR04283 family arsenosugar biosynthesis glycosyltransferase [Pseudomonadota bacterium]
MSAPVSVVVPTYQAAAQIGPTLADLADGVLAGVVRDLVIADGGSSDAVAEVADAAGARLIVAPRGRGSQLAAGCAAARGDWLLVVHADTRLAPGWAEAVARHLCDAPGAAGYFALRFDDESVAARLVAGWANLRARLFALPYGDQGLLLPRTLYDAAGGYAAIPLMEDVSLVRAIVRTGGRRALRPLASVATTSAERYRREGWLRRGARNLAILVRWRLGAALTHRPRSQPPWMRSA